MEKTQQEMIFIIRLKKYIDGTISPKPLKNFWDTKEDFEMKVFKGSIENLKDAVSHNVPVVGFDRKNIYIQDSVPGFRNVKGK